MDSSQVNCLRLPPSDFFFHGSIVSKIFLIALPQEYRSQPKLSHFYPLWIIALSVGCIITAAGIHLSTFRRLLLWI